MLIRWSSHPAEQMVDSWGQFNRLFDQAFGARNGGDWTGRQSWIPAADVAEDDKQFVLTLELPGIKSDEVKIDLEGRTLTLSGQKQERPGERLRRGQRSFQRVFSLPEQIDTDRIEASLADGILTVKLPKVPKAQPRKIEIRSAPPAEVAVSR